ncbi:MAG: amino acid permease, partial [Holosporaceae bacterium]|nr:amino acid permease [Holosporaceae bacterium]
YIGGAIVISGVIPSEELLISKAPYVDAANKIFGKYGSMAMVITGILGIVGSLNGWILIQGQVPYSAAQEGLFPQYFLKTNKYNTPSGVFIGSLLMMALFLLTYQPAIAQYIHLLINISVMAMLLPYFYSTIAFCYMMFLKKNTLSEFEKISLPLVGCIAILYLLAAIIGLGEQLISLAFLILLITPLFYCFIKKA